MESENFTCLGIPGDRHIAGPPVRSEFADDEDFAELIEFFLSALEDRKSSMLLALADEDLGTLKMLAHQLKGAGGGYGFPELSDHASRLEQACLLGSVPDVQKSVNLVLSYVDRIVA